MYRFFIAIVAVVGLGVAVAAVPPGTHDEIVARLKPAGALCKEGDDCGKAAVAASTGPMSGDQVYGTYCKTCHEAGIGGAPVYGNAEQWAPRIATGIDALWGSTLNGKAGMPPRGTCMNCSEDELRAALEFMVEAGQ